MGNFLIIALIGLLTSNSPLPYARQSTSTSQQEKPRLPEPDRLLQASIERVMLGLEDLNRAQKRAELDSLQSLAGPDYGHLVPQLFLFSRQAKSTRNGMAFGVIVGSLRISDGSVLRALTPLLEVPGEQLQADLAGYLSEFEGATASRRPSFEHYRDFLRPATAVGKELPMGLVRYLFKRDPGQALLLLMSVERASSEHRRQFLWAEHRIADALWQEQHGFREKGTRAGDASAELNRMALHSAWYARYFAVECLSQFPHLGERAWLEKLGQDKDARVSTAARRAFGNK